MERKCGAEPEELKKAVVRIRNAAINRVLSPLWAKGPVFVRVIEVSEAQRLKGMTMNPSVTVAFSQSMAKIERMNVNNYKKESLVFADLDEAQLSALGLNWIEGRFWTKEEEERELESSEEDEDDPPELEDENVADEMEAAVMDSQRIAKMLIGRQWCRAIRSVPQRRQLRRLEWPSRRRPSWRQRWRPRR